MSTELVSVAVDGVVAKILIDRAAKRNAFTIDMLHQLDAILGEIEEHPTVRVVTIEGAGGRSFSSGADLASFAEQGRESAWRRWVPLGHRVFGRLAALHVPTIAILSGDAFGGGLELALACDLRLAAQHVSVGLPEVGIGTLPGWGGTGRLVTAIGGARARQMILTGKPVSGIEAETWGLVTECVPAADLARLCETYVTALAAQAPVAIGLAKRVLAGLDDIGTRAAVLEGLASALTVTTDDLAEGIAAFRGKRTSEFRGR